MFYSEKESNTSQTPTLVRRSKRSHHLERKSLSEQHREREHKQVCQPFGRHKRRNLQGSNPQTCVGKMEDEACSTMGTMDICTVSLEQQILERAGSLHGASVKLGRRLPAGLHIVTAMQEGANPIVGRAAFAPGACTHRYQRFIALRASNTGNGLCARTMATGSGLATQIGGGS
jgi:hypothetical protein